MCVSTIKTHSSPNGPSRRAHVSRARRGQARGVGPSGARTCQGRHRAICGRREHPPETGHSPLRASPRLRPNRNRRPFPCAHSAVPPSPSSGGSCSSHAHTSFSACAGRQGSGTTCSSSGHPQDASATATLSSGRRRHSWPLTLRRHAGPCLSQRNWGRGWTWSSWREHLAASIWDTSWGTVGEAGASIPLSHPTSVEATSSPTPAPRSQVASVMGEQSPQAEKR